MHRTSPQGKRGKAGVRGTRGDRGPKVGQKIHNFRVLFCVFDYKHAIRWLVLVFKGENGEEGLEGLPGWPGSLVSP